MTNTKVTPSQPLASAGVHTGQLRLDTGIFCPLTTLPDTPTPNQGKKQLPPKDSNSVLEKRKRTASDSGDASSSEALDLEEEDSDDANDDEDGEEDEPESFAPSHGADVNKNCETGLHSGPSHINRAKKMKFSKPEETDKKVNSGRGRASSISSLSSVSSVSSVSFDGSDASGDSDAEYEGVDDVTDGEDEDLDVEKLEEEMIVGEFDGESESIASFPRGLGDEWNGFDDLGHQPLYSAGSFFDDEHILLPSHSTELAIDPNVTSEHIETPVPRRVHFADSEEDSSDSDKSTDDELLSDFLQQDSLDPDLRRMIENDGHTPKRARNVDDASAAHNFYELPSNIYHVESDSDVGYSSGYESDGGETTDEEDYPPPATITHPRSILRRESSMSLSPDDEDESTNSRPARRRGPIRGTFIADPSKPVAVVAPNGNQLIVIPPFASKTHDWLDSATQSLANTAANSPLGNESDSEVVLASPTHPALSPMLSSAANLMMSAVVGNDPTGQMTGPPEAFYPNGKYVLESFDDDDDEEDSEAALNVDDFIDFGDGSSDDEDKAADETDNLESPIVTSSINVNITPTPNRTAEASSAERLLNHFDRGIVTAFRQNHTRYQTLIRLPHHREFMPSNSPSRLSSAFRRSKLTETRTPPRKRKASSYIGGEAVRRKLLDSHRRNATAL